MDDLNFTVFGQRSFPHPFRRQIMAGPLFAKINRVGRLTKDATKVSEITEI